MEYLDQATKTKIYIKDENLIRPSDIEKHIGEVVSFHNGLGYVVTGVLTGVKYDNDEYSFAPPYDDLEYEKELDMNMFYTPDRAYGIYQTVVYAKGIVVDGIIKDEQLSDVRYIAVLSDEERAFRDKMLSYSKEWFERNYDTLTTLMDKYDDPNDSDLYDWDILTEEDKKLVNDIFNEK